MDLDQQRASGSSILRGQLVTALADEPLTAKLSPSLIFGGPAAPVSHMVISQVSAFFYCTLRSPSLNAPAPASGLFIVRADVAIDTVELWGVNMTPQHVGGFRGCALQTQFSEVPLSSGAFLVQMSWAGADRIILPSDCELRAILVCAPGVNACGPGVGSNGLITAVGLSERNVSL